MSNHEDKLSRREFLVRSAALGVSAALGAKGSPLEGAEVAVAPVPRVVLGKTGEKVSILGFGGVHQRIPPALLNAALQRGVNYIDTAEGYGHGHNERDIGKVLEANGQRHQVFVVTKAGTYDPHALPERLAGSLERLRTDYVDAYFYHNLDQPDLLTEDLKAVLARLKKRGQIKYFGFSNHGAHVVECLEKAAEVGFVDVIMLRYNFRLDPRWGDPDPEWSDRFQRALDGCAKAKIGLVAMKTQAGAVSFADRVDPFEKAGLNRHQAVLKAVWSDKRIHVIVSQMTNVQQVMENTETALQSLTAQESALLRQYAQATRFSHCQGCAEICEGACGHPIRIADLLRYKLYHDDYGDVERARALFARLPAEAKNLAGVDFRAAEAACPYRAPIARLVQEAVRQLA